MRNTSQDSERGNLDQVMLPLDAGGYDRAAQTVKNGIVDDDIGAALDKIRARGADVWIIFDACHAGSMTRGVFDGLAVRGIESSRLGIPPAPPSAATRGSSGKSSRFVTRPSAPNEGSLVEFFAVDSSREAIERSFDEFDRPMIGKGSDRRVGVFTYFLYRALTDSSGRVATYRDLAHHVVREMQRSQIAPPAMPTFGGALDRPLLSIGKAPPPAAWQVTLSGNTVEIPAGALHGLTEKSVLKLSASPAPDAPPWAQATVSRADPISAVAEIDGRVPPSPPPVLWARVASPGVSFALKVAEPPPHDLDANTRRLIEEAKAQAARSRQGAIDWVGAKDHADVLLRVRDGRLWLLPADGEWVREDSRRDVPKLKAHPLTPSYPVASSASVGHVADALHKIARARNMVRLAEVADPTRHPTNPWNALQVSAERVVAPGADKHPHRACPNLKTPLGAGAQGQGDRSQIAGAGLSLRPGADHGAQQRQPRRRSQPLVYRRAGRHQQARPGLHRHGAAGRTAGAPAVDHHLGPAEERARQRRPRARRDHGGRAQGRVADQPLLHPGGGARRRGCQDARRQYHAG